MIFLLFLLGLERLVVGAVLDGRTDMAISNVVGSNTFNILGCLGISDLVSAFGGLVVPPALLHFEVWVMLAVAFACLPVFPSEHSIARWEGGVFVAYCGAYVAYLILAAQQHDALGSFSSAMLIFVITVLTFFVVLRRAGSGLHHRR